jgi:hypothetical protein
LTLIWTLSFAIALQRYAALLAIVMTQIILSIADT